MIRKEDKIPIKKGRHWPVTMLSVSRCRRWQWTLCTSPVNVSIMSLLCIMSRENYYYYGLAVWRTCRTSCCV